jgi:hypothetical protein
MAVLLLLSLILLIIASDRRHDRRAIAKRPLPRVILQERRGRLPAPSAPTSNVIAFRPAATNAGRQRRRVR